jgi:DNA-binding NarL/FixJ family response regulator
MGTANAITVALIADNRLMREALTAMLGRLGDVRVVASAEADPIFLAEAKPCVLLLDAELGGREIVHAAAALRRQSPDAEIVVMDLRPAEQDIIELVNAGVSGFVLRDATFEELAGTIRSVVNGEKVLPPRMTESLFSQIANENDTRERAYGFDDAHLTPREQEVIDLIGAGRSNKEIAQQLGIATYTVKSHVRNVMEKLALHTRLQIAAYSHRERTAQLA